MRRLDPGERRTLVRDTAGLAVAVFAYGLVYGVLARGAGFSLAEAMAFSLLVVAGASQFAAAGMLAAGVSWPLIVLTTALLNARHLLYSSALAPWFAGLSRPRRAILAYLVTDEAFALGIRRFTAIRRVDVPGFLIGGCGVVLAWWLATAAGVLGATALPEPRSLGLDLVFPAAFGALTVSLVRGRPELVAALAGVAVAVPLALAGGTAAGIVGGGVFGPLAGLLAGGLPRSGLPGRGESRASDAAVGPAAGSAEATGAAPDA